MINFFTRIYHKFIVLWFTTAILPLFVSFLYMITIRYILLKICADPDVIINPEYYEAQVIQDNDDSKIVVINTNRPYIPSNNYDSYFPVDPFFDFYSNNELSPYLIFDNTSESTPLFTVSYDDVLPDTIVIDPPFYDKSLPFEEPVEIRFEIADSKDIIIYNILDSSIQKDMFHSIYEPSYKGKQQTYINVFDLHLQITEIVSQRIQNSDSDFLTQNDMMQLIQSEVKLYMNKFNVYTQLSKENLRDTQHFMNLLLSELITNSIIVYENEKFILHGIARALVFETLLYVEGRADFNDPRIAHIISRFMHYDD